MASDPVVITAVGAVTPVGLGWDATWESLLAGRSGVGGITLFDSARTGGTVAGEATGFDPEAVLGRRDARRASRGSALAVAAAREAWESAGIGDFDPARVGVVVGAALGGFDLVAEQVRTAEEKGPDRISPHFLSNVLADAPSGWISIDLGLRGPNYAVVSACATGAHAIGAGADMVRSGQADAVLAGGTEAIINELVIGGFMSMRALGTAREGEGPESASRPFDATRNGFVLGEGAVVVVLERLADALARGVAPLAELRAYGASADAHHLVAPHPDGTGVVEMMRSALRRGGVDPSEVAYVNAHGTSTPLNDAAESRAIRDVFGRHADRLGVSSTKSMTGHMMGAAGALETAVCARALAEGILPPTINLVERDAACDLDYVGEGARRVGGMRYALSNSMGLGGHNGCTLLASLS